VIRWLRERRKRKDAAAYDRCRTWFDHASTAPSTATRTCSGEVRSIRQIARTGIKAYVYWPALHSSTGIWIKGCTYLPRGPIVAKGALGYGTHHDETVFYVDTYETYPSKLLHRSRRYLEERQSARASADAF